MKQLKVSESFKQNNQLLIDTLIIKFIVDMMSPLSITDHTAFKNLLKGIKITVYI